MCFQFIIASKRKLVGLTVEQVLDEIDMDYTDVSLDGFSDEGDSDELNGPGDTDNLETREY